LPHINADTLIFSSVFQSFRIINFFVNFIIFG
jgi:hypothetical protein